MSIVGRGLGRNRNASALLVTAGLGLGGVGSLAPPSGPDEPTRSDPRRRIDFTDDDLMQIAVAIIVSGALDG